VSEKVLIAIAVAAVSFLFFHIGREVIRHFHDSSSRTELPVAAIKATGLLAVVALMVFVASFSSDAYSAGELVGKVLGMALLAYLGWELLKRLIVRPPRGKK
jgi:uncharacterized membrane protein YdfJ with MMPL/SSD domain